jgi:DNA modification methylase
MRNTSVFAEMVFGDCLDIMPSLGTVDAIISDLPYGTTQCAWDSVIDLNKFWGINDRINKGRTVLTASQPFTSILVNSNIRKFKHEWIWCKNRSTGALNANISPMKAHESILVFGKGLYSPQKTKGHKPVNNFYSRDHGECYGTDSENSGGGSTERYPRSVQYFDCERGLRPTQKPVPLMEYLIRTYTRPFDVVLDCTAGSGTTGVACVNTGRNFIGIENDKECYERATKRIKEALKNA